MKTYQNHRSNRIDGFTLVEVLVVITVIAILASLLSVAVSRAFFRAREFAVQNEMTQMEAAIERFNTEFGFYPPSFKNMTPDRMLTFLSRIAPQNAEASTAAGAEDPRIVVWWNQVGSELANADNAGADLVFWLSGLSKNKQFPLTNPTTGAPLAAHNFNTNDNQFERQDFYEFEQSRVNVNGFVASYSLSDRALIPFLYLDAGSYLPTNTSSTDVSDPEVIDGAYVFAGTTQEQVEMAATDPAVFRRIYPNPDTFQLISFGIDGIAFGAVDGTEDPPVPNDVARCGARGADNLVNFGGEGITKLETVVLSSQ